MYEKTSNPFNDKIYGKDWHAWGDPDLPESVNPIQLLLDRHLDSPLQTKSAVIVDNVATNYRELAQLVRRASSNLAAADLRPGERLLLFGTDSLDYVVTWLAAIRIGVVPAVVSDLHKSKDLLYFLRDTAARALFIDVEQIEKLLETAPRFPASLKTVILRGGTTDAIADRISGRRVVPFTAIRDGDAGDVDAHAHHPDDVAYMFYSGGTTGTPKGITHLAHDFYLVPERHGHYWEYLESDIVFATSKKYFTHGIWPGVLIPLYWGATAVLIRQPAQPAVVLDVLGRHRVTKLITVPTVIKNLLEYVSSKQEKPSFPNLKLVVSASEKIPPETFERFQSAFGLEILDSIGSSEITYEWIANRPREFKRGSLGKPVFGCEVRLVDATGNDVTQPNVSGEAWIRSRTACFYYWRKYDRSRKTFIGSWSRTGDNLYFDEDGFFWFSGRQNDVFKVSGLWVSPIEIEAALTRHPAVKEAAVISFEDGAGLTKPKAFVVLRDGYQRTDALIDELRTEVRLLGGYKVPASFQFCAELPRTPLQKIDRRALRELDQAAVSRIRRKVSLERCTRNAANPII
jgi:benzoate-CoA ligase family protein